MTLAQYIKKHAYEKLSEPITLANGNKVNEYIDLRNVTLRAEGLHQVAFELRHDILARFSFSAIGGPCVGADPIIGALLHDYAKSILMSDTKGFLVRKESKTHGKGGRIVGPLQVSNRCAMIDDVVTTGQSLLDAVLEVQKFGCEVVCACSVVDRLQGAADLFATHGIPYKSLLTIDDITSC